MRRAITIICRVLGIPTAQDLFHAIRGADTDKVGKIVSRRPRLANSMNGGRTPLTLAIAKGVQEQKGHVAMVEVLLNAGACVNDRCKYEDLNGLLSDSSEGNASNPESGLTPLRVAVVASLFIEVKGGDPIPLIELLLASGADTAATGSATGTTALSIAVGGAPVRVAELLLQHGADPNARDAEGKTVLFNATGRDMAELLLSNGADVNARNLEGQTALQIADARGFTELASLLRAQCGE